MASSSAKAIELKDAYVSDLISKGHGKQPEIKMPEVDHGDVAIEPLTMAIGAAVAGAAALWRTPEIMEAGSNILSGLNPQTILESAKLITSYKPQWKWNDTLGDGLTSIKVANILQGM